MTRLTLTCRLSLFWGAMTLGTGCAVSHPSPEGFVYRDIPVTQESTMGGPNGIVNFRGIPLRLYGHGVGVGDTLRSAHVSRSDLSLIDLADTKGTVRIITLVPSLDTRVCEQQTHYLSERNGGLDGSVQLITISVDTPFAQARFAREAKISNIDFFSDYRGGQFGRTHGLFLEEPHLLARAVMVVDQHNIIRHLQITPDLGQLPDLEKAFQVARSLL